MGDAEGQGPQQLEAELRRRLAGYKLVLEIGLDEPTVTRARESIAALARGRGGIVSMLASAFPATLVVYIAGEANALYDGALWPHVSIPELRGRGAYDLGPAFARALRSLGMEEFEQLLADGALRYVSPILAHGGIPCFSAGDFWTLLTNELARAPGAEAQELVTFWTQSPGAFRYKDAPVKRFLLYGGQPALDFLDRCIDLANSGGEAGQRSGLPVHIVETFEHLSETRQIRAGHRGPALPRPRVLLDPWDSVGPVLELPAVAPAFADARWRVGGETVREYRASTTEARPVALAPAPAWEVEFIDRSLPVPRTYRFDALATPALCFDPSTRANVRTIRPLFIEDIWLITPDGSDIRIDDGTDGSATPRVIEELPPLAGPWRDYSVRHLDLRNVRSLAVSHLGPDGNTSTANVKVAAASERARPVGAASPGVTTAEGFPIFAERPKLFIPDFPGVPASRWRIEIRTDAARQCTAADLGGVGAPRDLGTLLPTDYLGVCEISVRGPLGSDLRGAFALATGLSVTQPAHVLLPGETAEVTIAAGADVAIADRAPGQKLVRSLAADESQLTVPLRHGSHTLAAVVRIAQLQWAVHRPNGQSAFAADVLTLDVDQLRAGEVDALLVSTFKPNLDLWLVTERSDGQHLQVSEHARTSRIGGRWRFPLDKFTDTIAASGESNLLLTLRIEGRSVPLAHVVARLDVKDIRAEGDSVGGIARVVLRFTESRPLRGRVAYLWSIDRPWEPPVEARIPDGVTGIATFDPGVVLPGAYSAQVVIADAWNAPQRPRRSDPGVEYVFVSGPVPLGDATAPLSMLEALMREGVLPAAFTNEAARSVASEIVACVVATLADLPAAKRPSPTLRFLAQLLFADTSAGCAQLAAAVATERLSESEAIRFSVSALPQVRPAEVPDATLRALWRSCAPLAAACDAPRAWNDDSAAERVREFAGWKPGTPLPPVGQGLKADGAWSRESVEDIRAHQRDWSLLTTAANIAAYVLASYEWLAVAKTDMQPIDTWWRNFAWLVAPKDAPAFGVTYLRSRVSNYGTPWTQFPAAILAATFHTVLRDDQAGSAERALAAATAFAPKLVAHDLCFAIIAHAARGHSPMGEAQPMPTHAIEPAANAPRPVEPAPTPPPPTSSPPAGEPPEDPHVLNALRMWSDRLRRRSSFLMFSDQELRALARHQPITADALRPLVSPEKLDRYAGEIIRVIASYRS